MQLQAAHYSFLVISLLSLHPQQQILTITSFPVCFASMFLHSQYQLLKPSALSSSTSLQAGEFFVYKSVLQVTSSNLSIQHTYLLLQAVSIVIHSLLSVSFRCIQSGRFGRNSVDASSVSDHFITPTPKAKPPSSAQLLLYAVGRNRAK